MTLKEYLSSQDLSESDFAKAIGTSQAAVNRYCGARVPTPEVMKRIIAATKGAVTADDFFQIKAAQ